MWNLAASLAASPVGNHCYRSSKETPTPIPTYWCWFIDHRLVIDDLLVKHQISSNYISYLSHIWRRFTTFRAFPPASVRTNELPGSKYNKRSLILIKKIKYWNNVTKTRRSMVITTSLENEYFFKDKRFILLANSMVKVFFYRILHVFELQKTKDKRLE